jgi:hypothetical protein
MMMDSAHIPPLSDRLEKPGLYRGLLLRLRAASRARLQGELPERFHQVIAKSVQERRDLAQLLGFMAIEVVEIDEELRLPAESFDVEVLLGPQLGGDDLPCAVPALVHE